MKTKAIETRRWQGRTYWRAVFLLLSLLMAVNIIGAHGRVLRDGDKTYIVDQTGERWDVSQAKELGFRPSGFQYGIGKYTFRTLDDGALSKETKDIHRNLRVIGIAGDKESQAYSVSKLSYHEIANTHIDAEPIAVGY